jgi:hypothetical protein
MLRTQQDDESSHVQRDACTASLQACGDVQLPARAGATVIWRHVSPDGREQHYALASTSKLLDRSVAHCGSAGAQHVRAPS